MTNNSDADEAAGQSVPPLCSPRVVGVAAVALLVLLGGPLVSLLWPRSIPSTQDRTDVSASAAGWVDEQRCADCHEQSREFALTGHANTLRPADDPESLKLLRELAESPLGQSESVAVMMPDGQPVGVRNAGKIRHSIPLHWCVGSGQHARTWISTMPDALGSMDLLEFRWTWFHSIADFVATPGHPEAAGEGAIASLGLLFDGPRAWRCFSCHSSRLPVVDGVIDESGIHGGVTCQRCHGPRARHVATEGAYQDPAWILSDRDDSVARCAQCHRRADEQKPGTVRPDNPDIVRFQPIGLSQSKCYQQSQMSCTSCHDPHRPMASQNPRGIWQCVQCHDPAATDHTLCGAGMADNCLDCHMPAVETVPHLPFTDHWIRVRQESELAR
jgi:hypothetical protein